MYPNINVKVFPTWVKGRKDKDTDTQRNKYRKKTTLDRYRHIVQNFTDITCSTDYLLSNKTKAFKH